MAIYRAIHTAFWTDSKVTEYMTPEDRYFMLYILTNPLTNTLGTYEISKRVMSYDTGYNIETIDKLVDRFTNIHKLIQYDKESRELLIENWGKYNWLNSDKTLSRIMIEVNLLKSDEFKKQLIVRLSNHYKRDLQIDGASMGHIWGSYAEHKQNINKTKHKHKEKTLSSDKHSTGLPSKKIIDYFNSKTNSQYKFGTTKTVADIKARFNQGFTEEDFYKVIDKKFDEWHGTDSQKFLTPATLFGPKFESYLNQTQSTVSKKSNENLSSHTDTPEDIEKAIASGTIVV